MVPLILGMILVNAAAFSSIFMSSLILVPANSNIASFFYLKYQSVSSFASIRIARWTTNALVVVFFVSSSLCTPSYTKFCIWGSTLSPGALVIFLPLFIYLPKFVGTVPHGVAREWRMKLLKKILQTQMTLVQ